MYCWPYPTLSALIRGVRALFRSSLPGCLIGRLLPRLLLSEKGISAENIQVAKTDTGKPYFARRILSVLTLAPSSTVMLLPTGHVRRRSTHRV